MTSQDPFNPIPLDSNFRMPAEWEPHEATWLAWPQNEETWPAEKISRVRETYLQILEALLPREKVKLLFGHERDFEGVIASLQKRKISHKNLIPYFRSTADVWIRDYGPIFLKNPQGEKAWCKWNFNAWGGKYACLAQDHLVFEEAGAWIPFRRFGPGMILEGGSIEVNGEGLCLTTEECLLNQNRNAAFSREEIETKLEEYLGITRVIWLGRGIAGDDTDGHIDDLARFVNAHTVAMVFEEDTTDENYKILLDHRRRLEESRDLGGRKLDLIQLPMPGRVVVDGRRLPASYANFYIANGVVLLPVFDDPHDKGVLAIFRDLFPRREIVPIPCRELVYGLGALHCVTQQEPA